MTALSKPDQVIIMQAAEPTSVQDPSPILLSDKEVMSWVPDVLQHFLNLLADFPLLLFIVLVSFGYLTGKLLQLVLTRGFSKITSKTSTDIDDRLVEIARRPVLVTTVILSMLLYTVVLDLPFKINNLSISFLATILLLSWARASFKTVHMILELISGSRERFEIVQERTIPLFDMTLKILLVAAVAYALLLIWGIDPTAWLASAGVIGIAVGFAAKDSLANLFSGIFIVADAPYKIGDYIVLSSGERGKVTPRKICTDDR